jgi:hypothetical protein
MFFSAFLLLAAVEVSGPISVLNANLLVIRLRLGHRTACTSLWFSAENYAGPSLTISPPQY